MDSTTNPNTPSTQSLYTRLGGSSAIDTVVAVDFGAVVVVVVVVVVILLVIGVVVVVVRIVIELVDLLTLTLVDVAEINVLQAVLHVQTPGQMVL